MPKLIKRLILNNPIEIVRLNHSSLNKMEYLK